MRYIYKPIANTRQIGRKRSHSEIKFIVIHYTGNYSVGADAEAHYKYLQRATRYGSAHYYVDDRQIIQTIGDSRVAWSVGDNQGKGRYLNGCTNNNSISIEMCVNADADQKKTYKNVLELTKNLMRKFKVPASRVCRHYDVSRKDCPHNFRANNWALWWQFKEEIKAPIEWTIDLSKSSDFGPQARAGGPLAEVTDVEDLKAQDKARKEYLMTQKIDPDYLPEWAEKEWEEAKELGITDGTRPGALLTRAEGAIMALRAYKAKEAKNGKCDCADGGSVGYRTGL
ncbi:MAG: N-acetylmuramoyl-L-alanine amidase family protein [Aedoeadaptatus pacaensis]